MSNTGGWYHELASRHGSISIADASTDLLTSDVSVTRGCKLRVTIGIEPAASDAVLSVLINDGSTKVEFPMNDNVALTAGNLYSFEFGAAAGYSYQFQLSAATTLATILVQEVRGE